MDHVLIERGARSACETDATKILDFVYGFGVGELTESELLGRLHAIMRTHRELVVKNETSPLVGDIDESGDHSEIGYPI